MKVYLGPYKNWFGPYQFCDKVLFFLNEDRREKIAEKLPLKLFDWLDSLRPRKEKIKIHYYDSWNAMHTIALISHPILIQLRNTKHGCPFVDDYDVPEEFRSTSAPPKKEEHDLDDLFLQRWNWVLDEIIFAVGCYVDESWEDKYYMDDKFDKEGWEKEYNRIKNGMILFGKYYGALWD